jgi:hypothetical protein
VIGIFKGARWTTTADNCPSRCTACAVCRRSSRCW